MTLWEAVITLAIVVAGLIVAVVQLGKRVDELEGWVLPRKERERKQAELERLRAAVQQRFGDGIMVPDEILRRAFPENYPPDEESKPPDDSSV
jgi:hypothetical protein